MARSNLRATKLADLDEVYHVLAYLEMNSKSLEDIISKHSEVSSVPPEHVKQQSQEVFIQHLATVTHPPRTIVATLAQCGHCGKPSSTKCGRCKNVSYCDTKCQKADWAAHKTICDPNLLPGLPRPSPNHRRAILLPESGERPELVWIEIETETETAGLPKMFDVLHDNGKEGQIGTGAIVLREYHNGEHLDHGIHLTFRTGAFTDKTLKTNAVFVNLTKNKAPKVYKGPLLLYGMTRELAGQESKATAVDLQPCDLGLAVRAVAQMAEEQMAHLVAKGLDGLVEK
ncbi:hypothetical protein LTS10_012315 [Elasticomyces elasticus]|nr:hypothetical protein LTS10_012315 [Elasticomyces elasticus]